jgi:hypothetical protein
MHQGLFGLAVAAALLGIQAIGAAPDAPTSDESCELHVWPGSPLGSVYSGWAHGGIVNGAVDGRAGYPKVPADPLDTKSQAALLAAADLPHLLGLGSYTLVMHDTALPSRTLRATPGRLAPSSSPCYAELAVDDVTLRQDIVNGSWLMVLFRYRAFDGGDQRDARFASWVKTPLDGWKNGQDRDTAVASLRAAFRADIGLFAKAATKSAGAANRG